MLIAALVPAGTSAALLTGPPVDEPRVPTSGNGEPAGQVVKYSKGACGNAPKFNEYACAVSGSPQAPGIGSVRVVFAARKGGPKFPLKPLLALVSATRQGVMG